MDSKQGIEGLEIGVALLASYAETGHILCFFSYTEKGANEFDS